MSAARAAFNFCRWLLLLLLQVPGMSAWDDPDLQQLLQSSKPWHMLQAKLCRQELAGEQRKRSWTSLTSCSTLRKKSFADAVYCWPYSKGQDSWMKNKTQHTIDSSICHAVAFADACVTCCSLQKDTSHAVVIAQISRQFCCAAQPCLMPLTLG
jgi:hypothetical protein